MVIDVILREEEKDYCIDIEVCAREFISFTLLWVCKG